MRWPSAGRALRRYGASACRTPSPNPTTPNCRRGSASAAWGGPLIHHADNTIIGAAGFEEEEAVPGILVLGFDIVPEYRNQGHATESGGALISWGMSQPGVYAVTARCEATNTPSHRVLDKIGMRLTGMRDGVLFWAHRR